MNTNISPVLISGDALVDVDMCWCSWFLISSNLFSCLAAGSSWRCDDSRWRVNKAVSDRRGAEPAVPLSVKLERKTAGGSVNLAGPSGTWALNAGAVFARRVQAAYRRLGAVIRDSV